MRAVHGLFPLGLQLGKGFFAQVPGLAPALGERVKFTHLCFPVGIALVRGGPGLEFFDDGQALSLVGLGLLATWVSQTSTPLWASVQASSKRFQSP